MTTPGPVAVAGLGLPWRDHPFLVEESAAWEVVELRHSPEAVLLDVRGRASGRAALVGLGEPVALAAAVGDALGAAAHPAVASFTRGTWALVPPTAAATSGLAPTMAWGWLVCAEAPPAQEGEDAVRPLTDHRARAQAARLLAEAYPDSRLRPLHHAARWWGWYDAGGVLRATAGATRRSPTGPVRIGGVATDPAWRGRGLAAAVTAAAVRAALQDAPWVSLGVGADNDAARRVYLRLGFAVAGEFETLRAR